MEAALRAKGITDLATLARLPIETLRQLLGGVLRERPIGELAEVLRALPTLTLRAEAPPYSARPGRGERGEGASRGDATGAGGRAAA